MNRMTSRATGSAWRSPSALSRNTAGASGWNRSREKALSSISPFPPGPLPGSKRRANMQKTMTTMPNIPQRQISKKLQRRPDIRDNLLEPGQTYGPDANQEETALEPASTIHLVRTGASLAACAGNAPGG